jgi:hypothetical protein
MKETKLKDESPSLASQEATSLFNISTCSRIKSLFTTLLYPSICILERGATRQLLTIFPLRFSMVRLVHHAGLWLTKAKAKREKSQDQAESP